ncbi:RelA/SpoT domain-containing protein [Intestinibacter sp.]|uniref:RelA/SpoT domain-containing protein n=1 Tax=Intestinibacter sp. TaxID=1965304 RepID=UPI002A91C167|nr:RelA/SpoT domain-containing protein [Intestinibacter sp.]MDY5212823.1 RelA/SpoT domain-containing protein [Intestinibacter sp.]
MDRNYFLDMYGLAAQDLIDLNINWIDLYNILQDYKKSIDICDARLMYVANVLRQHPKVHSVKTRVKDPKRLLQKLVRKTPDRREKYGENYNFNIQNYKDEITDIMGIRVIHLFKEDWEEIHQFITEKWEVIEIVANIREGDNVAPFEEKSIPVRSRISGYRSVHYLIKYGTKYDSSIIEIQVRTIFEEGYGEIDHQLRYSHDYDIPEVLAQNLMLLNRIAGTSDEMASLINKLNQSFSEIETKYNKKLKYKNDMLRDLRKKIYENDSLKKEERESIVRDIDDVILGDRPKNLISK